MEKKLGEFIKPFFGSEERREVKGYFFTREELEELLTRYRKATAYEGKWEDSTAVVFENAKDFINDNVVGEE